MVRYDRNWYDSASDYFTDFIPGGGVEYLTPEEIQHDYPLFLDMLEAVDMGFRPTETLGWEYLKLEYGWDDEDFDWEDFREWYDATH
jgi:hypothetical protein